LLSNNQNPSMFYLLYICILYMSQRVGLPIILKKGRRHTEISGYLYGNMVQP
jgi:hypothetical protein